MPLKPHASRAARQRGLVLVLALIVLAALSLAAVGLMRGVAAGNRVAGNLAFQQAAVQAADAGIERAVAWLEQQAVATVPSPGAAAAAAASQPVPPPVPAQRLNNHLPQAGDADTVRYIATRGDPNFAAGQTWESYWQTLVAAGRVNNLVVDANGNQTSYVIHRLCGTVGPPASARCESSPDKRTAETNSQGGGAKVNPPSTVYYRITVRVQGPRNATSFIQAVVAI